MEKHILEQYIDACALIKETEDEIRKLKRQRKRIEQDIVKGSSPEFPYTAQSFHIPLFVIRGALRSRRRY